MRKNNDAEIPHNQTNPFKKKSGIKIAREDENRVTQKYIRTPEIKMQKRRKCSYCNS